MVSRRELLLAGAAAASTAASIQGLRTASAAQPSARWAHSYSGNPEPAALPPAEPGKHYTPVVTPNGTTLDFKVVDGVKVFHLIAEEVEHEFAPGLRAKCWGYNGRVHGPTIEAVEGDRVRI